jgi:hypothetical protein
MIIVVALLCIVAIVYGPQWWASRTLRRYNDELAHLPGTGGELARHLLDRFQLQDVALELTGKGDHYDPQSRVVRLEEAHMQGRSLTAVAVAAHEVGHAIQHASGYRPLAMRSRLVDATQWLQRAGALLMMLFPVAVLLTRAPVAGLLVAVAGLCMLGFPVLVHLVTLPVEWDASFQRALPILRDGNYVAGYELKAVERILFACALTYVAASLASLLNVARWWMILRGA